jgi:hypothetical protein
MMALRHLSNLRITAGTSLCGNQTKDTLSRFVGLAITRAYIWQYCAYVIRVHWMPRTGMCHGSKGPWLEVSTDVTCSAQVLSVCLRDEERIHKTRGEDVLGLGTKLRLRSQRYITTVLNTGTPRGFTPLSFYSTWPVMTSQDVISCGPTRT